MHLALNLLRKRAKSVQSCTLDARVEGSQALAHALILEGGLVTDAATTRPLDQLLESLVVSVDLAEA